MDRREFLRAAALGASALSLPPLFAQDKAASFEELTREQIDAIDRGLRWLAKNQYSTGGIGSTCQVAFTGLAGLAFLANNSTPYRGTYAKNVRDALKFILRNTSKVGYINEAAGRGAQVVVLPEALTLGWTHPSANSDADEIPGGFSCAKLRDAARRNSIYVCAGLIERASETVFNSAVLIDPQGEVILHHRKLNELEIGHEFYAQGDRLGVAHTPLGTFGVMICADAFARGQTVGRALGLMGADIILSPCAWAVPADASANGRFPTAQHVLVGPGAKSDTIVLRTTFGLVPGRAAQSVEEHDLLLALITAKASAAEIERVAREHKLATLTAFQEAQA